MNRVVFEPKNIRKFSLHCPFSNEKMDNEDNSFEIYEGAGNYLFSMCEDCLLVLGTMMRVKNIGMNLL